ncbi:uncharacterized protein LOC141629839 [Silene latifolia]|uniref:uncharacterized protein LOC141629839 n=1 Tax=Silene latifolia TaxID=37657 RepID=UPI003D77C6C1
MLFSRGDLTSITLMLSAFSTFSLASGLHMNSGKSSFDCNGVGDSMVKDIETLTGMKRGNISFKYLAVKIMPKRLGVLDCQCLVDKVTERIQRLGARQLSYAERVVLISAVLSSLHNYWADIFMLPKLVLKKIDSVCRAFLWYGTKNKERPYLVAWNQICQPKKKGGLGFKNLYQWNISLIAKYVRWVKKKADHLWVRWVHAIYIKDRLWKDYEPSISSSWAWKRICEVKNKLKHHMFDEAWRGNDQEYSVQLGYSWLAEEVADVPWYTWIRNRIMLPKHEVFIWLVARNRLLTQDRLMKMNIVQGNCCFLCGAAEETIDHLFFLCPFSQQCRQHIATWLDYPIPNQTVISWWLGYRDRSLLRKHIIAACMAHVMYSIWYVRNRCRLENVIPLHAVVIKQLKKLFILQLKPSCVGSSIRSVQTWITQLE